jgi:hypothetical protein
LWAWTGDTLAAEWGGPILFWFVLGNGLLAIGAFQYYLQFAHGKLRLHVIFSTLSGCIQIPVIIYAALEYGALGVAIVWFVLRLVTFVIWTPIVHSQYAPGIHWPWLLKDVAPAYLLTVILLAMIRLQNFELYSMGRVGVIAVILSIGIMVFLANILVASEGRKILIKMINMRGSI